MTPIPSLVVLLFSFMLCFKFASSIFCYDCNSAFDPRCGENFDSFSLGVVNCSLRDPPDHIEPVEPTFCRVIKMETQRSPNHFDSFRLGVVNCSLRDPPDHIEPVKPRVIKMEIYGTVRIVRQCGYIKDENGEHTCRRQTGNDDLFVTYCTCDTDLCNASTKLMDNKVVLITATVLYGLVNYLL